MKFGTTLMFVVFLGLTCANADQDALKLLDDYLIRWDRFARGENDLAPSLKKHKPEFEARLASNLRSDPKHAVPRLVFYAVVQIGEFFPIKSELGKEVARLFDSLPVFVDEEKNNQRSIFGGYVYLSWREHRGHATTRWKSGNSES